MTDIGFLLILIVLLLFSINIIYFFIRVYKFFSKSQLNYARKKKLKKVMRLNLLYAIVALVIGFVLL